MISTAEGETSAGAALFGGQPGKGLLLVIFYPQLSGMTVSMDYTKRVLQWLPTWKFT